MKLHYALTTGGAFAVLVAIAHFDPDDFSRLDTLAQRLVLPLQQFPGVEFFFALTVIGSTTGIILLALLAAFLVRRDRAAVWGIALSLLGTSASVWLVKHLIARARPETLDWLGSLHTYSFPSGHAASAMALFGFLTVYLARRYRGTLRTALVAACVLLIAGIGLSRIVLAAHYASDVLAGYLLGALWVSIALGTRSPLRQSGRVH